MTGEATSDAYFRRQWEGSGDPWNHGGRWYETRKYEITVASLPRPHYARTFEPGCGAGFLTRRLAARTDVLVAYEREPEGVRATSERCSDLGHVQVTEARAPGDWPDGPLDLIVVSELLYYFDDRTLDSMLDRLQDAARAGADVVAAHYRRHVADHARSGDDAHDRLRAALGEPSIAHVEPAFLIHGWSATGAEHDEDS